MHAFEANTPFEKLPGTQINVPRLNLHKRPRHRRCPTSRDFVPWRFSDAGRRSAWIASSCRHPKTYTNCDFTLPAKHDRFHPETRHGVAPKKGLDVRDRITEGIEAGWPRRPAARFTRARCGRCRTRPNEEPGRLSSGNLGPPRELWSARHRFAPEAFGKRFLQFFLACRGAVPGRKFGLTSSRPGFAIRQSLPRTTK